jgi:hypothetical protein
MGPASLCKLPCNFIFHPQQRECRYYIYVLSRPLSLISCNDGPQHLVDVINQAIYLGWSMNANIKLTSLLVVMEILRSDKGDLSCSVYKFVEIDWLPSVTYVRVQHWH